jgi:ubiquitin-protein ligase
MALDSLLERRLVADLLAIEKGRRDGSLRFTAEPIDGNIKNWHVVLRGLEGTDWEGARLQLDMLFPDTYPFMPPKVCFRTPNMFHPNVSAKGDQICIDLFYCHWTPADNAISALLAVQGVLAWPNPESAFNCEAARMYKNHREEYRRRVRAIVQASCMDP